MALGMVYSMAVVWFAHDFRHKDRINRVLDVLYSRPVSNADLVLGKYFGALIPVVILSLVLAPITVTINLIPISRV